MRLALLALVLLAGACRKNEPPAPSAEQSAELNDADEMLNNLSNEEARPTSPSNSSR